MPTWPGVPDSPGPAASSPTGGTLRSFYRMGDREQISDQKFSWAAGMID